MHFVADDWSGSGDWTARSGGWVATVTGAPSRQATSQFPGRFEVYSFSTTKYFTTASDAAHRVLTTDEITFEAIVKKDAAGMVQTLFATSKGSSNGAYLFWNVAHVANAVGLFDATRSATATTAAAGRYYHIAAVYDLDGPNNVVEIFINGVSEGSTTTTTANSVTTNQVLRLGCGYFPVSNALTNGAIVEFLRHRTKLSAATIAARAAEFNRLRGY